MEQGLVRSEIKQFDWEKAKSVLINGHNYLGRDESIRYVFF